MENKDINLYDIFIKYSYKDIMKLFQDSKILCQLTLMHCLTRWKILRRW